MDTMLNEGHYRGREGCLFRCGMVPEPGATRLATLAATQNSLLALSRRCGYAMLGQEVNSPRTGAKPCSFLPECIHLKMLKIEGLRVCKKKSSGPEPAGLFQRAECAPPCSSWHFPRGPGPTPWCLLAAFQHRSQASQPCLLVGAPARSLCLERSCPFSSSGSCVWSKPPPLLRHKFHPTSSKAPLTTPATSDLS